MQTKAPNPAEKLPEGDIPPLLQIYFEFNHLKQLYRQGWLRRGVPPERCESVAEHSFAVAILGSLVCDTLFPHLDKLQVLRMALFHDFGEIYAGDFIPADNLPTDKKKEIELNAVQRIFQNFPSGQIYIKLWTEYEHGDTPEAQLVRQLDKLEMALQAAVYQGDFSTNFDEFYQTARIALQDSAFLEIIDEVQKLSTN